ncbi:hypothetical protein PDG61_16790 [Mycolicibacterium sp. BiH015]|uniref:hypothetical protein n=1 Tax=Mycolicibacterium sp. BiH015 TaxID=3018808 RepID=UPI0022DE982E|nr:hypothetical protein [Mycolicibacterium sp. BiH015]MDA2892580.1 hypothetical protein [Mycolicibacterium sp. BiH015]
MTRTRALPVWWWIVNVALVLAVLLVGALGVRQVVDRSLVDTTPVANHADARDEVMKAATTATTKILTYKPETLEADLAAGLALTTGDFKNYYQQFTRDIVMPEANKKQVATTATVVRAGVVSLTTEDGVVIVFVNQTTTSTEKPEGALSSSSVEVGLQKVAGSWLIKSFDPV